jgi:hypothetical protein
MAHEYSPVEGINGNPCWRCKLPGEHRVHHGLAFWEVKSLPFANRSKHWFAYHPGKTITLHDTQAEALARVREDLREKQNG